MNQSSLELHRTLTTKIIKDYFLGESISNLTISKWNILDYSSVFSIENIDSKGIFVKVPKSNVEYDGVIPLLDKDIQMGKDEYDSLSYLSEKWMGNVRFVKALEYYPKYNAIITEKVYGYDLFLLLKKNDLWGRLVPSKLKKNNEIFSLIKKSLDDYHIASLAHENFRVKSDLDKIIRMTNKLSPYIKRKYYYTLLDKISKYEDNGRVLQYCQSLKGLDIRNFLIDNKDRITILDPGKRKSEPRVANISRLFVTCQIMYWGSMWFFLRLSPSGVSLKSLLDRSNLNNDEIRILNLLIIKEYLKHWIMANNALDKKKWAFFIKFFLQRFYIGAFYNKIIKLHLKELN